jgi:hypothetical protein
VSVKAHPGYKTFVSFGTIKTGASPSDVKPVSIEVPAKRGSDHTEAAEFDRFKDLAGKLTQVPKSEVDDKRSGS